MAEVLVVDDSETMRLAVEKVLNDAGISTVSAENGVAAIACFEKNPSVKLIVSDYNMPEMDGVSAIEKIRKLPGGDKVLVFMLTTETSPELKASGKAVGVKAWITKPLNDSKFLAVVQRVLGA